MADYLNTSLFFCDKALSQTSFSRGDLYAFVELERPCFTAGSRHGASADSIAAMLAAKGSDHPHLDFIVSKGKWPYDTPRFRVLPFEDLLPIAESIDSHAGVERTLDCIGDSVTQSRPGLRRKS
jgi:hypothetical protein